MVETFNVRISGDLAEQIMDIAGMTGLDRAEVTRICVRRGLTVKPDLRDGIGDLREATTRETTSLPAPFVTAPIPA